MASEWHIASFLTRITACCSNFIGKIGHTKVTMVFVILLVFTEIVFETKTLVYSITRKNSLNSLTDNKTYEKRPYCDYDASFCGYVALYAISNLAEILYFILWINVFSKDGVTPRWMHLLHIAIAVIL